MVKNAAIRKEAGALPIRGLPAIIKFKALSAILLIPALFTATHSQTKHVRFLVVMKIIYLLFVLCFFSCKGKTQQHLQEKFDQIKWATKQGKNYPYRDKVLKDLIANVKLKGLKKEAVLNLLGQPNRVDSNYLFYTIAVDYFAGSPVPLHTKTLVLKFTNDTVEWRKIHE